MRDRNASTSIVDLAEMSTLDIFSPSNPAYVSGWASWADIRKAHDKNSKNSMIEQFHAFRLPALPIPGEASLQLIMRTLPLPSILSLQCPFPLRSGGLNS